jgi:Ca-activated chloride channel family protein
VRPGARLFFIGVAIAVLGAAAPAIPVRDRSIVHTYAIVMLAIGFAAMVIAGAIWWRHRDDELPEPEPKRPEDKGPGTPEPKRPWTAERVFWLAWPWVMTIVLAGILVAIASAVFDVPVGRMWSELKYALHLSASKHPEQEHELRQVVWKHPHALVLALASGFVGLLGFHLQRRRTATIGFSAVKLVRTRGLGAYFAPLPTALRVLAVASLAVGLGRPETYRIVKHQVDSIDIMIVMDMSKSMEETDLPRDRMDAAQRVIRRFLRRNKNDRVGLVIFGQQAMLQCPLTHDTKILEKIVSDLVIGDVPELGTAIGDGLALAVAQLRRSDAKSKVVILLSDGDSNWVTRFDPDEAARVAAEQKIQVYTLLVGQEVSDLFGGMSVNPETLRNIATRTNGEFFRASDYASFDRGFQTVRNKLDTTKRTISERVPDKQLFVPFAVIAAALIALEFLLAHTRLRRLP